MHIQILKRLDFRQFRRFVSSFLLCFFLLIGIFGNYYRVSAIAGIDDILFWSTFTASGFAGTAGEAALTGKIAHDQYGVHFSSQSQAQSFVQNFYSWALNGGGLTSNPAGELVNAAGHKIFQTGYKAATSAFSIASLADLSAKLSLFIAGITDGTISYAALSGSTYSFDFASGVNGICAPVLWGASGSYHVLVTATCGTTSASRQFGLVQSSSAAGVVNANGYYGNTLNVKSGGVATTDFYLNGTFGPYWGVAVASSQTPAPVVFSVQVVPNGDASVCPDVSRVKTTTDVAGYTVADVVGAYGDKTGTVDAGVPIGLTSGSSQSIPMNDVIDGADTAEAEQEVTDAGVQVSDLENVQASQLADAASAEAAGDTTVSPDKDWTTKSNEKIDWSPLQNLTVVDRFPFCIPFDLINSISALKTPGKAPVWTLNFPTQYFVGGGSIVIDFSQFDTLATIIRWFLTFLFVVALILLTRNLIRG